MLNIGPDETPEEVNDVELESATGGALEYATIGVHCTWVAPE